MPSHATRAAISTASSTEKSSPTSRSDPPFGHRREATTDVGLAPPDPFFPFSWHGMLDNGRTLNNLPTAGQRAHSSWHLHESRARSQSKSASCYARSQPQAVGSALDLHIGIGSDFDRSREDSTPSPFLPSLLQGAPRGIPVPLPLRNTSHSHATSTRIPSLRSTRLGPAKTMIFTSQ